MSEYLGEEAVRAHEARIEALGMMFEDVGLQGKEMSAPMQEFDSRIFTHRFYHDAPNDVFELIFPPLSDVDDNGDGRGGLNVMRLVSKRCMRVVESVATRLTIDGAVNKLPTLALKQCRGIKHIRWNLGSPSFHGSRKSLEGCPDGLKSLYIGYGGLLDCLKPLSACKALKTLEIRDACCISDISPLSACTRIEKLILTYSTVTDLSPLASMLLLKELSVRGSSIKDVDIFIQCQMLQVLDIGDSRDIKDLSPLC